MLNVVNGDVTLQPLQPLLQALAFDGIAGTKGDKQGDAQGLISSWHTFTFS